MITIDQVVPGARFVCDDGKISEVIEVESERVLFADADRDGLRPVSGPEASLFKWRTEVFLREHRPPAPWTHWITHKGKPVKARIMATHPTGHLDVYTKEGDGINGMEARDVHPIEAPAPTPAPLPANPKAIHGAQKPDLSLVPGVAIAHEALAFENGAAKYGPYNWRENAVEARTYVAAAKRHLDAWLDGQECSNDTTPPVHNLGHARACLAIILDAQACGNLIDNRPLPGRSADVQDAMKAAKIGAAK